MLSKMRTILFLQHFTTHDKHSHNTRFVYKRCASSRQSKTEMENTRMRLQRYCVAGWQQRINDLRAQHISALQSKIVLDATQTCVCVFDCVSSPATQQWTDYVHTHQRTNEQANACVFCESIEHSKLGCRCVNSTLKLLDKLAYTEQG